MNVHNLFPSVTNKQPFQAHFKADLYQLKDLHVLADLNCEQPGSFSQHHH